eukprot:2200692-Prorocentrum_lima.AAC.1
MYYDTTPEGHVAKTYEWLSGQVLRHLENTRLAENRQKTQAHSRQPVGGKNPIRGACCEEFAQSQSRTGRGKS